MTYEDFHKSLVDELDRCFAAMPYGTKARIQREMGVSKDYFGHWRTSKTIPMRRLLEALDLLGVDARHFFAKALALPAHSSAIKVDETRELGEVGLLLEEKFAQFEQARRGGGDKP